MCPIGAPECPIGVNDSQRTKNFPKVSNTTIHTTGHSESFRRHYAKLKATLGGDPCRSPWQGVGHADTCAPGCAPAKATCFGVLAERFRKIKGHSLSKVNLPSRDYAGVALEGKSSGAVTSPTVPPKLVENIPPGAEVRECNLTQWHEPRKFLMLRTNPVQADRCYSEQQDGRADGADGNKEKSQVPPLQLTQGLGWVRSPCTAGEDGCMHWGSGCTTSTHTLWEDPDCPANHGIPTQVWRNKHPLRNWADEVEEEENAVASNVLPTPPPSPTPSAPDSETPSAPESENDLRHILNGARGGKGGKGAPHSTGRGGKGGLGPARSERGAASSRPYVPRHGKGGRGAAHGEKGKGRPPGLAPERPQVGGPGLGAPPRAEPEGITAVNGGYEITLLRGLAGYFEGDVLRMASPIKDLMRTLAADAPPPVQRQGGEDERKLRLRLVEDKV